MCGIVAYLGHQPAFPLLLDGLKSLEYRGYDSAGLAVIDNDSIVWEKQVGKTAVLTEHVKHLNGLRGTVGIAHTRWATHGGVTRENAHPHHDCTKNLWLVHNGIIENFRELKEDLQKKGHSFISQTDTEVIAHLIEEEQIQIKNISLEKAVRNSLAKLRGTYGLVVLDKRNPDSLIAVRYFSPLCLGIGTDELLVASDPSAILRQTRDVVYLENGEIAVLTNSGYRLSTFDDQEVNRQPVALDWTPETAQKQEYSHFMLKEIMSQSESLKDSMRGRLVLLDGVSKLGGLTGFEEQLKQARRIVIAACGTAYYAGRVGEYMLEEYANIPVEVDLASEFRYRQQALDKGDVVLVISQSGETADTLAAVEEAKRKNLPTLGIVNVVGSTIARETDAGVYQHIGPEIGVASTKAFTSQVTILALLTLFLGRSRGLSVTDGKKIASSLEKLPEMVQTILKQDKKIVAIARKYYRYNHFFFLGRKYSLPVALEGALKLKEVSYIHAEGYAAGELKHGPIALIDPDFPSVVIALSDSVYEKTLSNIAEIKARHGKVIAVATQGNRDIAALVDDVVYVPQTLEMLSPILSVIPLQLLAYHCGVLKGYDVDKPRNLAKSVTVE